MHQTATIVATVVHHVDCNKENNDTIFRRSGCFELEGCIVLNEHNTVFTRSILLYVIGLS